MLIIHIRLEDIAIQPGVREDLASLTAGEAAERIRAYYEFLSPNVEVHVADGLATITVPNQDPPRAHYCTSFGQSSS